MKMTETNEKNEQKAEESPMVDEYEALGEPGFIDAPEGEPLWPLIKAALKEIYDPEIPVNIYDLGLIYKTEIDENKKVLIEMTLTSPNCPVAESLPNSVKENVMEINEVTEVDLKLVWDPPWTKEKMSEAAKVELNL
mgnify:CR=1 FL=1